MQDTHPLSSTQNVIDKTKELIGEMAFCHRHRINEKAFTRQRKLTFVNSIVFLLQKTVRSIQTHLDSFFEALGQWLDSVTPSAWSQARLKLRHTAFIELNEEAILKVVYEQKGSFEVRRWKGHRLLAIDSSKIRLPNEEALGQEFSWVQCSNSYGLYGRYPEARLSILTDVLNRIAIETFLVPSEQNELSLAITHIQRLAVGDVGLLDRGFASYEVFAHFVHAQRLFVCRCQRSGFKAVNQLFAEDKEGRSIQVRLRPESHQRKAIGQAGLPQEITIRLVTVRLSTGELEVLATNLMDEELYPTDCFKELYHYRWGIETYYGLLKGRLDLENFSGLSSEAIRQDVHSTVFLSNLESILTRPANDQLQEQSRELKNRLQCNQAVCFHALKSQIIALLLSREPLPQLLEKLQQLFLNNPTAVRPDRKVPRRKQTDCRSYQYQRNVRKAVF